MPCLNRFSKFIIPLLLALGVFLTPSAKVFANTEVTEEFSIASNFVSGQEKLNDYKLSLDAYVGVDIVAKDGSFIRHVIYDFSAYTNEIISIVKEDNNYFLSFKRNGPILGKGFEEGLDYSNKDLIAYSSSGIGMFEIQKDYDTFYLTPTVYSGIKFSDDSDVGVFPPPPSLDDEDVFGYNFVYPSNGDVINLHATSNSYYYKVPFKVDVKNIGAFSTSKEEESIRDHSKINNYKTEIDTITWVKKHSWLGGENRYFVEGYFYIPTSTLNKEEVLNFNTYYPPTANWINNSISVKFTSDGSQPEYKPDSGDNGGNIDSDGNVNVGGDDYGQIPQPPKDGSVSDWFAYIGNLIFWIITYPFKLVGNIVSTLVGYVTNMFSILQPVTNQLNSVLSFIPSDILNACWGFLSFTILYSVIKSVFKMIRG